MPKKKAPKRSAGSRPQRAVSAAVPSEAAGVAAVQKLVGFDLTITDNPGPVSTKGKIYVEGAGPGSEPVLPGDVVVTPSSPASLALPAGGYVYWFVAAGNCAFTLNEERPPGVRVASQSYVAPTAGSFHFPVSP